jgi:hypothetical protein
MRRRRYRFYASSVRSLSLRLFITLSCFGCDILPQKGDTIGEQVQAEWQVAARLVVDTDPTYTIVRLRAEPLDSVHGGHHVLLSRFEFNPSPTDGDEYALVVALDLGNIHAVQRGTTYPLGPLGIPAYGTVTCLCRPLKPDSVRGTFTISQRGMGQIVGRIDATLFFTAWDDTSRHASYRLRQRIDGMR